MDLQRGVSEPMDLWRTAYQFYSKACYDTGWEFERFKSALEPTTHIKRNWFERARRAYLKHPRPKCYD